MHIVAAKLQGLPMYLDTIKVYAPTKDSPDEEINSNRRRVEVSNNSRLEWMMVSNLSKSAIKPTEKQVENFNKCLWFRQGRNCVQSLLTLSLHMTSMYCHKKSIPVCKWWVRLAIYTNDLVWQPHIAIKLCHLWKLLKVTLLVTKRQHRQIVTWHLWQGIQQKKQANVSSGKW